MKYLQQSVSSVLNQGFKDFEFLIIDDCSTDESWAYLQAINDARVHIFKNEINTGLFYNLNFLIKKSNSNLIKLWSQDDVMETNCIQEILAFHQRFPQIGFSYSGRRYIDANGDFLNISQIDETPELVSPQLHAHICFITGSIAGNIANVTLNKKTLEEVGYFNEQMKISGDFEMWVRLAKDNPVGFIKKELVQLRNHKDQLSGQEKYFIYHLKEDIEAYKILFGYITVKQAADGKIMLRNTKLIFYYTLMLKAVFKGRFTTAYRFCKLLGSFDNFLLLTWCYCKNKLSFQW